MRFNFLLLGAVVGLGCVGDSPNTPVPDASADTNAPVDSAADVVVGDSGVDVADVVDSGPPRPIVAIGGGGRSATTCAIKSNGAIHCWGDGSFGQLGDGKSGVSLVAVPVKNLPAQKTFVEVNTGQYHSCVRAQSGQVYCWGGNGSGMIGDGTTTDRLDPTPASGINGATMLSNNMTTVCAVDGTKTKCWGVFATGALARPTSTDHRIPMDALEDAVTSSNPITGATEVGVGGQRACVLQAGGVKCWGNNANGQAGAGANCTGSVCTPVGVVGLASGVVHLRVGLDHSCAIVTGGKLKCWGYNSLGQLGAVGPATLTDVPIADPIVDATLGVEHTCALTSLGEVWCWGRNSESECGKAPSSKEQPTKIPGLTNVVQVTAGAFHTCALLSSGEVWCWGSNKFDPATANIVGSLGNGTSVDFATAPVKVLGL